MNDSPFTSGASRRTSLRSIGLVALVVAAGLVAWFFTRDMGAPSMPEGHVHGAGASSTTSPVMIDSLTARRIGVTFATAERGELSRQVRVAGRVAVDETRQSVISPKVAGWVEQLFVSTTGVAVRAGAPLFALYSPMLVAAQEELVLAVRLADAAVARGEAEGTAADLVRSARRRLEYWDVPAEEIDRLIRTGLTSRTLVLRAPRDGVVLAKGVVAGQRIMEGDVAFAIAALDRVWVEGDVFEQDLAAVRVGATVDVEALAWPGRSRRGTIAFIAPIVQEETRTIRIRVELPNTDGRFKPGMLTTLLLNSRSGRSVLHVPRSAVLVTGTRSLVFVRRADGMLEPREVQIGGSAGDRQEVLSGLRAGEIVVRSATFLIDAESNLRAALGVMAPMQGSGTGALAAPPAPAMPPEHQH